MPTTIEIHNDEDVIVRTDDPIFAMYLDNQCHVKTKFNLEDGLLMLGKLAVIHDISAYYTTDQDTIIITDVSPDDIQEVSNG